MNTSKLRDSTAIDKALALTALESELEQKLKGNHEDHNDGEEAEADNPAPIDDAATVLRGISESSSGEIDALVTDLQGLREKLVDDGARVEQHIIDFTALNQSVMRLAKLIADGIAQVKVPDAAE